MSSPHDVLPSPDVAPPRASGAGTPKAGSFWALGAAIMRGFVRDKAAVFFAIVFPLMFLVLFGGLFADQSTGARVKRSIAAATANMTMAIVMGMVTVMRASAVFLPAASNRAAV